MQNVKSTRAILLSYLSYLILFVGTAFVSGAIVHVGNISELSKYAVIGTLGVILFITGSYIQEFILNKDNLKNEGIVKFFFFSLLLSVGIGMVSGGTQHYSDFPTYSSYLIPIGLVLSLIAYLLKNNYYITSKLWATIVGVFLLVSLPLHFGLIALANNLNAQSAKAKAELCIKKNSFIPLTIIAQASGGHDEVICPTGGNATSHNETTTAHNEVRGHNETNYKCPAAQSDKEMPGMCMSNSSMLSTPLVNDDKTFIQYVIPHHQDAVDASTKILASTQDIELKAFASNVIKTQGQEIATLKEYYKTWYGIEYPANGNYKQMMNLDNLGGQNLDKAYIQGMLGHHSGIIDVAKKVVVSDLSYTYKPEILALSKQIIKNQEADNIVLQKWLDSKYKNAVSTTPVKTNPQTPAVHDESDGHGGH